MVAYSALREALKALKDAGTIAYCTVGGEIGESVWWMSTWINNKTDRPQFNDRRRTEISEKVLKWLQAKCTDTAAVRRRERESQLTWSLRCREDTAASASELAARKSERQSVKT